MDDKEQDAPRRPPLRIGVFPKGSDVWRVDWFGSIAFPDRMARRKQPSVLVHLSKVLDPDMALEPGHLLDPGATLPTEYQAKRWVSVGTTMLLGIGDLWQDQLLIGTPQYETEVFADVEINQQTAVMVKAGSSLEEDGGFLLPLAEHPWHRGNTHSYCLRLTLADGRYLVVPCMELIRFYFGSSSELLSRLFMPPLNRQQLYTKAAWCHRRKRLTLTLAEGLPATSAADVGRVAGDETAWRAAMLVPSSCLRASVAGRDVFPQAVFPFEGMTNLTATGQWLSRGEEPQRTFLVYQLLTCSYRFPFAALRYVTTGESKRRAPHRAPFSSGDGQDARDQVLRKPRQPDRPVLREGDASSLLSGIARSLRPRRHFPDLDRKPVWSHRKLGSPSMTAWESGEIINDLAVGNAGSVQRIRPMSLAEALRPDRARMPEYLRQVVNAVRALDGVEVDILTASHEDGWTLPLSLCHDEDGVIANDQLISDEQGRERPRRVAVLSLAIAPDEQGPLIAVIESPILAPIFYAAHADDQHELSDVMARVADDFTRVLRRERRSLVGDPRATSRTDHVLKRWLTWALKRHGDMGRQR